MNEPHIHLLLAHVPIVGVVFGILVLGYAWYARKTETSHVGMAIFVISGLAAVIVYLTGEVAEEAVEHLPGISEAIIERHEDVAIFALYATAILGLTSLLGILFTRNREVPRWLNGSILILAFVVFAILGYTANLGGQINHPEIRSDAQTELHQQDLPYHEESVLSRAGRIRL